jgi:hypothetical protein
MIALVITGITIMASAVMSVANAGHTNHLALAAATRTAAVHTAANDPADGGLPYSWHDFSGDGRPDLIARQASTGNIYVYPFSGTFNGTATLSSPVLLLAGATDVNWIGVGELTGDLNPDLVVRRTDGTLWVYPGTGTLSVTGSLGDPVELGTGWNGLTSLVVTGAVGNSYDGIMARRGDGTLVMYPHTGEFDGDHTLSPAETLGVGWNGMSWIGSADVTEDDNSDIVSVRSDGALLIYPHSGVYNGTSTFVGPLQVGVGWNTVRPAALMDVTADVFVDILAVNSSGQLLVYRNAGGFNGNGTFTGPTVIGTGWNGMDLFA